jgi:hypothetical protein
MNWIDGVGVRPESTRVTPPEQSCGGDGARLHARVAVVTGTVFLGSVQQVEALLESGETVCSQVAHGEAPFAPGDRVCVSWDEAAEVRFSP